MPYSRPGYMHYTTATAAHRHGDPVVYDKVVGVAVKQKGAPSDVGLGSEAAGYASQAIASGEAFAIISKGIVQIYNTTNGRKGGTNLAAVKGSPVFITAAHALALAGPAAETGPYKFGRVVEVAGQRGTPAGMIRVDLDKKDSIV
jgi:hypothetical protein